MNQVTLGREQLAGLLKQSAKEMNDLIAERDVFKKFARAVEILPALEKSGAVSFPSGLAFSEKAFRLARKTSDELEKMAYMAEHINSSGFEDRAKLASDLKGREYANGYGVLTNRLLSKT